MGIEHLLPGVYAPVLSFFQTNNGELDVETFKTHVAYLAEAGVGPVICGSMGEAPMLNETERLTLVRAARSVIDENHYAVPLIVGTGLASTTETIHLTKKVAEAGADCALVIPSGYYASLMSREALKRFFSDVGSASPIPVMIYNFPGAAGGVDMDSDLLEELALEGDNFCGAKLTCSAIGKITRIAGLAASSDFTPSHAGSWQPTPGQAPFMVFGGFSDLMLPSMFAQAHGAIAGIGNFAPYTFRKLFELVRKANVSNDSQDLVNAQQLQTLVAEGDYQTTKLHIPGAKRILQDLRGYGGLPRQPLQTVDEALYEQTLRHPAVTKLFAVEKALSGKQDHGLPNGIPEDTEPENQRTISPVDQSVVVTRELATEATLEAALKSATEAFSTYRLLFLEERIAIAQRFLDQLAQSREALSRDLSLQMGRAISHCGVEVDGTIKRGEHMIRLARECLSDINNTETDTPDHRRYIKRVPVGPVLVISPWNYPYFCQINAVLPALLAGNPVILKPSPQTPLCGEWFEQLYRLAGLPPHVLQVLHVTPTQVDRLVRDPRIQYVMFTGSVANGHAVIKSASDSFKGVGVELGGKDPAYVRPDADLEVTVPGLVDGAFFNAGQSCCSVERIYVQSDIYDRFVNKYAERVRTYVLGEPSDPNTTMGPVVSKRSADSIRRQVADAIASGARALLPNELFPLATGDSNYVAPQVLVDVDHSMSIMKDETFGPVVGIMKVSSDDEAIRLMNDSPYGLTASVWTDAKISQEAFESFVDRLEAGTVYLNNCDNLDPALAWSGWKDSGRGISLSKLGFDAFLRTKSVNMKMW